MTRLQRVRPHVLSQCCFVLLVINNTCSFHRYDCSAIDRWHTILTDSPEIYYELSALFNRVHITRQASSSQSILKIELQ